jgi:hypothetical protein
MASSWPELPRDELQFRGRVVTHTPTGERFRPSEGELYATSQHDIDAYFIDATGCVVPLVRTTRRTRR